MDIILEQDAVPDINVGQQGVAPGTNVDKSIVEEGFESDNTWRKNYLGDIP